MWISLRRRRKKKELEPPKSKHSLGDYLEIIFIAVVFFDIFLLFRGVDLTRFFPNVTQQASVVVAFLFGLVASVSTCLILVGGIVLGFGSICHTDENKNHPIWVRAVPHVYFHIGRVVGFGLLGGVLGFLGKKISYSFSFTGYLTLFVALVMFYMGLYILGFVPNITKLGFHLPKALSKRIHAAERKNHHFTPIILGVLTFFLPCGFTQSMQLTAVASGSFFTGLLIMSTFALGTVPVLLSIGMGATFAKDLKFQTLKRCVGVLVLFFALYSFNSGAVLAGLRSPLESLTGPLLSREFVASEPNSILGSQKSSEQVVKMDVDWVFKPTRFVVQKGIPVRWEINGINITGCSNEVVIPTLNISKKIKPGLNVFEFTPQKTGRLNFSCWMGMLGGSFIVVDDPEIGSLAKKDISPSALENDIDLAEGYADPPFKAGSCGGSCGSSTCAAAQAKARGETAPCGCGGPR